MDWRRFIRLTRHGPHGPEASDHAIPPFTSWTASSGRFTVHSLTGSDKDAFLGRRIGGKQRVNGMIGELLSVAFVCLSMAVVIRLRPAVEGSIADKTVVDVPLQTSNGNSRASSRSR